MAQYLFLLRDNPANFASLSPSEMQELIMRYMNWRKGLAEKGYQPSGQKLRDDSGRFMTSSSGKVNVADGPFAESKEIVSGFFMITAQDYDEAVAIAKTCPHLDFGTLEVREIEPVGPPPEK